ncbi:MAG: amidoligase family protein [Sandaracinaceae bacterium]
MKTLRFGIEIETVGQTRHRVAEAIQSVVGGTVTHVGSPGCYDPYDVIAPDGRRWRVMADSSLSASFSLQAEVVSPILNYEDLETLQHIVRAIRRAGAKVDSSCGIHVHVDGARFDAKAACNLIKLVNKQEPLIEHALGINPNRRACFARGVDQAFLRRIEQERPRNLDALNLAWYGYDNRNPIHYDNTRYRGVNLHNLWFRGTVEYRYFDSTLHAGKVKAYVQFCLALSAKAIHSKRAVSTRRAFDPATSKYDFRCFLLRLGLIGPEFKTARLHLLSRLGGSSAWKGERRDGAVG